MINTFNRNRKFTAFRKIRRVSRVAVDEIVKEIKTRVSSRGTISMAPANSGTAFDWEVIKRGGKIIFYTPELTKGRFRQQVREFLTEYDVVGFILVSETGQKLTDGETEIKEMWGYRIMWQNNEPILERIPHDQLYDYCTIDFSSGRKLPPEVEIVYCGPNGKICGWDMV
jgi:hypothetical protein